MVTIMTMSCYIQNFWCMQLAAKSKREKNLNDPTPNIKKVIF